MSFLIDFTKETKPMIKRLKHVSHLRQVLNWQQILQKVHLAVAKK